MAFSLSAVLGPIASAVVPMLFGKSDGRNRGPQIVASSGGVGGGGQGQAAPQSLRNIYGQRGLFGVLTTPEEQGGLGGNFSNVLRTLAAPNPNAYLRLDPRQRQQFVQSLGEADRYATDAMGSLGAMSDERARQMDANIGEQLSAVRNVGQQQAQDIDARYDALAAARNNQVSESGFGNTTAVPGVRAMVERERGAAQRRNADAQAMLLGNIYGQRARALDSIAMQRQAMSGDLFSQTLAPRLSQAQQLGSPTQYQRPGFLGRLFS